MQQAPGGPKSRRFVGKDGRQWRQIVKSRNERLQNNRAERRMSQEKVLTVALCGQN